MWTTHTQHCQVCQDALKNINRLTVLAYVAAVVCFGVGVVVDARTVAMNAMPLATIEDGIATGEQTSVSFLNIIPTAGFWLAILGAILFTIVGYLLQKLSRLFYVYEFEHARNN